MIDDVMRLTDYLYADIARLNALLEVEHQLHLDAQIELSRIEGVCVAHGHDPEKGQPLDEWIGQRLRAADDGDDELERICALVGITEDETASEAVERVCRREERT